MSTGSRKRTRATRLAALVVAMAALAGTLAQGAQAAGARGGDPGAALVDRLVAAYPDREVDPSRRAWRLLVADAGFETTPVDVLELVRLEDTRGARERYDRYVAALTEEATAHGGTMVTVNDTLLVGLGPLRGYGDGVSWLARFPSLRAFVDTVLDRRVVAASRQRRVAVDEAQVLVGPNAIPPVILALPPDTPAADFPSDRVQGKTPDQIVDELLTIYPDGGTDPTRGVLERLIDRPGFADEPLIFVNLYEYGPDTGGAGALNEYNLDALPHVLAHGARPRSLVDVTHHLVGPTAWSRFIVVGWPSFAVFTDLRLHPGYIEAQQSRVVAAETYGNLVTIAR